MEQYRYFSVIGLTRRQFFPVGVRSLKLEYKLNENERRYSYDESFNGNLTLNNENGDFDYFYDLEQNAYKCRAIRIEIEKKDCDNNFFVWKVGRIKLVDAEFDIDSCTIKIKLLIENEYTCFDDNKDIEVNLLELPIKKSKADWIKGTFEKMNYNASSYLSLDDPAQFGGLHPGDLGWRCYKAVRHTATLPVSYTFYYGREVFVGPNPNNGTNNQNWIQVGLVGSSFKWARQPVLIYDWTITDTSPAFGDQYAINFTMFGDGSNGYWENGFFLNDALEYFFSNYCGKKLRSNFLGINPTASFDSTYPTLFRLFTNIMVFQKSDVKRPNDITKASNAPYTFKKLLVSACNMFNLQWRHIDNEYIIEHVSYFQRGYTLDTTIGDVKARIVRTRRYSYNTDKLPRFEKFLFMESGYKDFVGLPIEYPGDCASDDEGTRTKEINIEGVTTDVEYCLNNADGRSSIVSDNGIVFMATRYDATDQKYYAFIYGSILDTTNRINNVFGWAYLHALYHQYDRLQLKGYMNGQYTTFESTRPAKKRMRIAFKFCCGDTIDLTGLVKTNMGDAQIESASFILYEEQMELNLVYPDTTGNNACLKPYKFKFHHFDISFEAFYFETIFVTGSSFVTEIEAIKPDGTKQYFGYNPDTGGIAPATFPPYIEGVWKFRKRLICDVQYEGPWSDWETVDTTPLNPANCSGIAGTFVRRVGALFVFSFADIDIPAQAEVTRPGASGPYIVLGSANINGGVLPRNQRSFDINSVPPYNPNSVVFGGTYRFRFRRICNAALGIYSDWSAYVDVTI